MQIENRSYGRNWRLKVCCHQKYADHVFSTCGKFSERLIFLPPDTPHTRACARVRNVSFPENFVYVLNGLSVTKQTSYPISGWWGGSSKQQGQREWNVSRFSWNII